MFWSFFEMTFSSFVRMYYQRTFDAIVATPLLVEDVIAGEWLWGATKSVFAGTTILGILSLFGLVAWPWGLFVVPLTALGGILFASVGLIATSRARTIDSFNLPVFLLIFPMFLFSGTFFPLEILPAPLHAVAMALPLTHLAVLVRGACLGDFPTAWPASLAYLIVVSGVLSVAALVLMKRRLVK
jgi:lipooligosaccharide transport system permease protein